MSYVCVVIVNNLARNDIEAFEKSLFAQTENSNLWINRDYYRENELLPVEQEKHYIFEVCDRFEQADHSIVYSDVCQALLMPEGSLYSDPLLGVSIKNGSLVSRVRALGRILSFLEASGYHTDVFLGDSNAILKDYDVIKTTAMHSEQLILDYCLSNDYKPTFHLIMN